MSRTDRSTCLLFVFFATAAPAFGDGGLFYEVGEAAELAQTQQEVLMAIYSDAADGTAKVTYVLRTRYAGTPGDLAWVIPLPAIPTNVADHKTSKLIEELNELTAPLAFGFQETEESLHKRYTAPCPT